MKKKERKLKKALNRLNKTMLKQFRRSSDAIEYFNVLKLEMKKSYVRIARGNGL